jgi:hypothetical protein
MTVTAPVIPDGRPLSLPAGRPNEAGLEAMPGVLAAYQVSQQLPAASSNPSERAGGPNTALRQARVAHRSPSGSGRVLSRQELAEAVNEYLHERHGLRVKLDETYVGKLERGQHRWPNERYREAFRAVLGAADDAEIGFFIVRGRDSATAQSADVRAATAAVAANDDTRLLAAHWLEMLRVVGAWAHRHGAGPVMRLASTQASLIDTQRRALGAQGSVLLYVQARWYEFASWAADNSGDADASFELATKALSIAQQTRDARLSSYVLMRMAQQAAQQGQAGDAVDLGVKARREFGLMPGRTRALSLVREAHGHALAGDAAASRQAITMAFKSAESAGGDHVDALDGHCTPLYVAAYDGYLQMLLGRPSSAVSQLEEVLACWPGDVKQDEVTWRSWLAQAYGRSGRLAEADIERLRAVELADATGSFRVLDALKAPFGDSGGAPRTARSAARGADA